MTDIAKEMCDLADEPIIPDREGRALLRRGAAEIVRLRTPQAGGMPGREAIMFELYRFSYPNRWDWPREQMWESFQASRASLKWRECERSADAILALAQPSQEGREWQSMDTAPKDGTKILLRFAPPFFDATEDGVAVGCWTGNSTNWWLSCVWSSSDAHREPTGWMPLPTPSRPTPSEGG